MTAEEKEFPANRRVFRLKRIRKGGAYGTIRLGGSARAETAKYTKQTKTGKVRRKENRS